MCDGILILFFFSLHKLHLPGVYAFSFLSRYLRFETDECDVQRKWNVLLPTEKSEWLSKQTLVFLHRTKILIKQKWQKKGKLKNADAIVAFNIEFIDRDFKFSFITAQQVYTAKLDLCKKTPTKSDDERVRVLASYEQELMRIPTTKFKSDWFWCHINNDHLIWFINLHVKRSGEKDDCLST